MAISRMRRVNEVMRQVLGDAITSDLNDPRVNMVTVNSVETSPDLHHAKVFITVLGDEDARADALTALKRAHGFLQSKVARETSMKHTPTLTFEYDESVEKGLRIAALLDMDPDDPEAPDRDENEPGN
ncbi:MAG TPA: 30S ribosome-binding factor RbfA [Solirubrobacterales bacterium]|nr:30S ribosome-binding factor RbfA [Solirubrobacterales bacterium]